MTVDSTEKGLSRNQASLSPSDRDSSHPRILVHLDCFYDQMVPETFARLHAIEKPFDVIITTDSEDKLQSALSRSRPPCAREVHGKLRPNRGRNIAALIDVAMHFQDYELLLHVHTKKSPGAPRIGALWREHLFDRLLSNSTYVDRILDLFDRDPILGIAHPEPFEPIVKYMAWGKHLDSAQCLMATLGLPTRDMETEQPMFPTGMMFWFRPRCISPLFNPKLHYGEFPGEPIPNNFTLAHTVERILDHVCRSTGHRSICIRPDEHGDLSWQESPPAPG